MRNLLISLAILLIAPPLQAQWRWAGLHGADVRSLIVDSRNPDRLFLGTSSGEVYVSHDGARNWILPRSAPFPGYVIDNLAVDRLGNLWAAAWGLWGGGVIAVSSDEGRTWTRRDAGLEDFSVRAFAVGAKDNRFVVAGGLTGVHRSLDGGETWEKISDQVDVESLAIDPRDRDWIFVGTRRQGWRTRDGGKTWNRIAKGMVLDTDMFAITIDPLQPDNIWVATCGWVYNSRNGGDLWTRYRDGFENRRIQAVAIDPADPSIIWAGSVAGLYRSDDIGLTWSRVTDDRLVVRAIALHARRKQRIVLGVEGDGVFVSNDHGTTFERRSEGLHNLRIASIAVDPLVADRVYAAILFGGSASGIYRSDDAGKTWKRASRTALPEVLTLAVASDGEAGAKFLAGTERGFFASDDGEEWTQTEPSAAPIRVEKLLRLTRERWFAATSEGVFTTRDGGRAWTRVNESSSRAADIAIGSLGGRSALFALTASGLEVFDGERWLAIEGAPSRGRSLAVRSVGGRETVYIAGSNGVGAGAVEDGRWTPVPVPAPAMPNASVFSSVRGALFLASRGRGEILVNDPAGDAWSEVAIPIRNGEITSIAEDPFKPDRIYVGTGGEGLVIFEGTLRRRVEP